jgi:hypothetical protein
MVDPNGKIKRGVTTRTLLTVQFEGECFHPGDEAELDTVEAYLVGGHNDYQYWHVGGECTTNYMTIYPGDIDGWIELFQAMKEYKEE